MSDRFRRRTVLWILGVALVVLVALGLLAIPLLGVPGNAQAAKADLGRAMDALQDGDEATARRSVVSARAHVDDARDGAEGIGGDVWGALPWLGTPVDDVQHLVQALDDTTAVAEIGVDLYPSVAGEKATLFSDDQIDRATLDRAIAGAHDIHDHLRSADTALSEVEGSTPVIGEAIRARRDQAADQVRPLTDAFAHVEPMLGELPGFFGFDGKQQYLIALLNPSDLRYSSGTPQAFAAMSWRDGKVEVSDGLDLRSNPRLIEPIYWPRVKGNYFHYRRPIQVRNATFAPSWSVSGEELLRGWTAATGERYDGLLAVDVVAFAQLFDVTGGVTVPGLGDLTSDNLVKKLVGSYDDYYPDADTLDTYSAQVIPKFKDRLFNSGDFVEKAKVVGAAAGGRHLAFYARNPTLEEGAVALGLDGDLATPEGDYLGVFTQSVLPSKSDYWQQRQVRLDVALANDGSAINQLDVKIHNDSPPYVVSGSDPGEGYFTRWTGFALGVFLPNGVEVDSVQVPGQRWKRFVGTFYDQDFFYQHVLLEPQAQTRLRARYQVPDAANVDDDGTLTYHLAMDPQGLVRPQRVSVTVHLPEGYRASDLPEGWTADGDTVTYMVDDLAKSEEWAISLEESN